jgi:hypothetical protein
MAYRGKYKLKNPLKYDGDPDKIVYRSMWERKMMVRFDRDPNILEWSSEEYVVPYKTNRWRRYFPDFVVSTRQKDGSLKTIMIEIKPYKQTIIPPKPKKRTRKYLREHYIYRLNSAKWTAAKAYCEAKGWEFQIITEKDVKFY